MILIYPNTLDLNHRVRVFLFLLVAFVWVLIKKALCLQPWAVFLIAHMYIMQTSKEVKDVITESTKGSFEKSTTV